MPAAAADTPAPCAPLAASHSFAPYAARREGRARCHFVEAAEFGPCAACGAGEPPVCAGCAARPGAGGAASAQRLSTLLAARADVRRGDIVQLAWLDYRNEGSYIFDGRGAAPLDCSVDDYGGVPPEYLVPTQFPVGYWAGVIDHNAYEWLDPAALPGRPRACCGAPPGVGLAAPEPRPGAGAGAVVYIPFAHAGAPHCLILDAPWAGTAAATGHVAALEAAVAGRAPILVAREPQALELRPSAMPPAPRLLYHRVAAGGAPLAPHD